MDAIRDLPWGWAWLAFFGIVLVRAGATYAVGRGIAAGLIRREPGERTQRALARVHRWGPPVITASFLTVGAQTVINAAAGLARMPVPRYLLGLVPGAAIWATVWTTLGLGAFYVALESGAQRTPALIVAGAALVVLAGVLAVVARKGEEPR